MLTVVIILKGKRLSYMYRKNTQCSLLLQISMIRKCKHKCKKKEVQNSNIKKNLLCKRYEMSLKEKKIS